jgi:hypothetical protein
MGRNAWNQTKRDESSPLAGRFFERVFRTIVPKPDRSKAHHLDDLNTAVRRAMHEQFVAPIDSGRPCICGHESTSHHPRPPHSCEATQDCLCVRYEPSEHNGT